MLEFKGYEGIKISIRKECITAVVDCHGRTDVHVKGSNDPFLVYEVYEDVVKKIRGSELRKGNPVWVRRIGKPWVVRIYAGAEKSCYYDGECHNETLTIWDEIKPFEQGVNPNE
jgi:hypothetical protein